MGLSPVIQRVRVWRNIFVSLELKGRWPTVAWSMVSCTPYERKASWVCTRG